MWAHTHALKQYEHVHSFSRIIQTAAHNRPLQGILEYYYRKSGEILQEAFDENILFEF